jgi:hypothetical protein
MNSNKESIRPLVLVDIDGVVNAFGARKVLAHQRAVRIGQYRIVLDTRHPEWFAELAKEAELRWATMWQAGAARQFSPVAGFGADWDFLGFDAWYAGQPMHVIRQARNMTGTGVGSYKWPMILEAGEAARPMVWIDDDMTDEQIIWAIERSQRVAPTLFIRPDPEHGFTVAQYKRVLNFVQTYTMERAVAA